MEMWRRNEQGKRKDKKRTGQEIQQEKKSETEDEGEEKGMGARTGRVDRKRGY